MEMTNDAAPDPRPQMPTVERVMPEFKHGELRTGTSGPKC